MDPPSESHRLFVRLFYTYLLCEIWKLLQDAKDDANNWEQGSRDKTKREQDDEDIERLIQYSRRTTRSQLCISQNPTGDNVKNSGSRKRKAAPSYADRTPCSIPA